MTADLEELITEDSQGPWRRSYWDKHPFRAILKVDLHQTSPEGCKLKRYKNITPCKWMVSANQLADNAASVGVGTLQCSTYQEMANRTPRDCTAGDGLQFYFTYEEKRLNKDTPKEISRIISNEMCQRACQSDSQGLLS